MEKTVGEKGGVCGMERGEARECKRERCIGIILAMPRILCKICATLKSRELVAHGADRYEIGKIRAF